MDQALNDEVYQKGAQPSLIESFSIVGLYGYRDISLSSPYAATILIAQNGSGKTTLLGVLDAFLKRQFTRLRELQFTEIRCKIKDFDELVLRQSDLLQFLDIPTDSEIARASKKYDLDTTKLFRFLSEEYDRIKHNYAALSDESVYNNIAKISGHRYKEIKEILDKIRLTIFAHNAPIESISNNLSQALKDIEIVYLPTYRRIELPLTDESEVGPYHRRNRQKFKFTSNSIYTADIQFGLADIFERLADLNQSILFDSNTGYRQISADIVNELIDGVLELENYDNEEIPSKEELNLFFSRLKEWTRAGPFDALSIPNIDKIYTEEDIPAQSNKFLRYFLHKLNVVIKATRGIELQVEDFIRNCNKYLSSRDMSTKLPEKDNSSELSYNSDDKILRLDRRSLKVYAESIPTHKKISLNALSSGEKQMISLFAKLFLYPENKIILIDEPELSLSLDWQRQILLDVINAPLTKQIIAITHSPFVFDNDLEPFARSLNLSINITQLDETLAGEEVDLND